MGELWTILESAYAAGGFKGELLCVAGSAGLTEPLSSLANLRRRAFSFFLCFFAKLCYSSSLINLSRISARFIVE